MKRAAPDTHAQQRDQRQRTVATARGGTLAVGTRDDVTAYVQQHSHVKHARATTLARMYVMYARNVRNRRCVNPRAVIALVCVRMCSLSFVSGAPVPYTVVITPVGEEERSTIAQFVSLITAAGPTPARVQSMITCATASESSFLSASTCRSLARSLIETADIEVCDPGTNSDATEALQQLMGVLRRLPRLAVVILAGELHANSNRCLAKFVRESTTLTGLNVQHLCDSNAWFKYEGSRKLLFTAFGASATLRELRVFVEYPEDFVALTACLAASKSLTSLVLRARGDEHDEGVPDLEDEEDDDDYGDFGNQLRTQIEVTEANMARQEAYIAARDKFARDIVEGRIGTALKIIRVVTPAHRAWGLNDALEQEYRGGWEKVTAAMKTRGSSGSRNLK